ncbi:MAG: hypothetical protein D3910_25380 [Candidatus Electrothrix sp. ATG2]|nr:hypothetical protein [Candidatus Electrothrix sp. ATG2]
MKSPTPKTLRGKIVWFVLKNLPGLFFILILFGAALVIGQQVNKQKVVREKELKNATAAEAPLTNVVVLELNPTVLRDKISLPGLIEPWAKLSLMAKLAGSIEDIVVQEGDHVEANAFIFSLQTKNVFVFDAYSLLVGEDGKIHPQYSLDLLHLNQEGYRVLNQELERFIANLSVDDTSHPINKSELLEGHGEKFDKTL